MIGDHGVHREHARRQRDSARQCLHFSQRKDREIINTDAEGRSISADVLDYAQDLKPDASSTSRLSQARSRSRSANSAARILGNEELLIQALRRAGEVNGERIWQLPLYDEYFEDLKSDTADMKNSGQRRHTAERSAGAIFLKQFIRKGVAVGAPGYRGDRTGIDASFVYPEKSGRAAFTSGRSRNSPRTF